MDYYFPGNPQEGTATAVVARESISKNLISTVIPQKGEDIDWATTQWASSAQ